MKTLQIICLFVLIGFGTSCKKEAETPSVQQQEQGTLPDSPVDTVAPPVTDTLNSSQTP
ncbi:hypothetical protein [Flavobacterium zepuense]|uniref:hypothetical protein n=1 Tax=Flavobacterium zepuense TaxID=2593302 RepID=UPI00163D6750|nr:hypothetical protein [Flavobacterium zepuense]